MTARSRRRPRGMFFLQIMVMLAATAAVLTAASVLLGRAWKAHRAATAVADRTVIFEQLTNTLRRDFANTDAIQLSDGTLTLDNNVLWTTAGKLIERHDGAAKRTFPLDADATFAPAPGGAALRLVPVDGESSTITFTSPVAWAAEVAK